MTTEAETLSSEAPASRMRSVFDRAPVPALVVGPDGRVQIANGAATRLLSHSDEALAGCDLRELVQTRGVAASMRVGQLTDGSTVVQIVDSPTREPVGLRIEEQRAFRSALLELSELSHTETDDARFYATLLSRAVSVVPGSQAGSILLHRPGTDEYHFVAAQGFDLAALQQRCLYKSEMFRDVDSQEATINRDVVSMTISDEQREWLETAGRLHEIVVNVSAPVFVAGHPVAFISLDNFDDPAAFSEASVDMTTVIGRLIADLLRRRELEAEVRRERESFRHLALHDGLTGLANRRHIETALAEVAENPTRTDDAIAVFFVDIDDFKDVNDRFGHEAGDEVIVAVSDALRRVVRSGDLVGRWGGDEFMLIVREISRRSGAEQLGNRILQLLDDDVVLSDGRSVRCRLSIGAAWDTGRRIDTEALVRSADAALYDAKHAGKHTVRVAER